MTPRAALALSALLVAALLAGCADGHSHEEGMHGVVDEPALLVGVENKGTNDLAVSVTLTAPNGTVVWRESFTAGAGNLPEKHHDLGGTGIFTLDVAYSWQKEGRVDEAKDRAIIDTAECSGLTHITFVVDSTDAIQALDTHRECHE